MRTALLESRFDLESLGLADCDRVLGEHLEAVRRQFGPSALGVIDLPTLGTGRLIGEQIRVTGVLYWASEVEQAGLVPFMEHLAEAIVRGTIVEPLGSVVPELTRFWRSREYRFTSVERTALFARLFGSGAPGATSAFQAEFSELIRGLTAIGRAPITEGPGQLVARVAVLAQQLGNTLSNAGVGIAAFAARDIVGQIRTALRLLQHPDLVRVMGGGTPWQIVARHAQRVLGHEVQPDAHAARALSGLRIITWIAAEAPRLEGGTLRLDRRAPVIHEAEAWSAASGVG